MTTSRETGNLNFSALRGLIDAASALPLEDRITLLKGLMPGIAIQTTPRDFDGLLVELRLKGERFFDAMNHPGEGRKLRHVMGERDIEER